ncbi:Pentatricopeptide repeat-containing protein [Rhynchospora pubera]|uniref:Pentatricopeptide repeat-containing protein n=1 Tax=Rhynchospora pubera TaxID=906938 RepID=A0AAV8CSQ3_9POAL|nr:Pentatricopeptide repeat-containing protein [Rhynchospora pubera]
MSSLLSSALLPSSPTILSTPNPSSSKPNSATVTPTPTPTPCLRARLSRLCRQGRLDEARHLFDSLPRPAPTLLWNALLIGYVCNSLPNHALHFFSLMMHHRPSPTSPSPDAYTFSSALKACALSGHLQLGRSIHAHLIRSRSHLLRNFVVRNSLLNMYASATEASVLSTSDATCKVFDRMPQRNIVSWNTIIAWYVKTCRPYEAFLTFIRLMESGIKLSPLSFVGLFPAGVSLEAYSRRSVDAMYGLLIKHGQEYIDDLFVLSSAIGMFAGIGDMESARHAFDQAEQRNTEVWNTMIAGYEQNGFYVEAIDLFIKLLHSDSINADTCTFLTTLMAISQLQDLRLGQQVHAYLLKQKISELPVILCNASVVMYSRCGSIETAFELFNRMPKRDLVSWNTMITAMVQNNLNYEGFLLTLEMKKEGLIADSVTLTALLSAASNLGSLRIGKETHGYLIRNDIQWEGMGSYIIDMYAKSGSIEIARRYFDNCLSSGRDQVTWNAMIAAYTRTSLTEQAISVFHEMLRDGQNPNAVTLSSILSVCNAVRGKQVHSFAVLNGLDKNILLGTSLIEMYLKWGDITSAEKVFEKLPDKSTALYTTMLYGFGHHGFAHKSLALFHSMQEELDNSPDSAAFLAVISACRHSGLVDEGLHVYNYMSAYDIAPTPEHHCCVVDMLGRHGRVEEAYELAQSLGTDGNYVGIWGSLLAACRLHRKLQLSKLVSEKLLQIDRDYGGGAGQRVILSNPYALGGIWDGVEGVRREMKERRMNKDSWVGRCQISNEKYALL